MSDRVLGIDLGISGALALVGRDGGLIDVADMPVLHDGAKGRATVNAPLLATLVAKWRPSEAFVEYIGPRPAEGAVGAFAFRQCKGVVIGVMGALAVPVAFLTPPAWKRL